MGREPGPRAPGALVARHPRARDSLGIDRKERYIRSMHRPKALISACLLGRRCRYDGQVLPSTEQPSLPLLNEVDLVAVCPEEAGGLPTPRPPACCVGGDGHAVLSGEGSVRNVEDVADKTAEFRRGAQVALKLAQENNCVFALLKAHSPSCGIAQTYQRRDIHSEQALLPGQGVTAALLQREGIPLFSEADIHLREEELRARLFPSAADDAS